MTTWQEACTPIEATTYRDLNLEAIEEAGGTVNGWSDDAPQRALVEGESRAEAAESLIISDLAKTASPTTCSAAGATWVDAVMGWYQLQNSDGSTGRLPATQAVWAVPLVIAAAGAPLTINSSNASDIQLQSQSGAIFQCTQESNVTLNGSSNFKGTVRFTARLPGVSGNVTPGQITKVISGPAGLDVDLDLDQVRTLTARDLETDSSFVARGLGQLARQGAGWTRPAFDYLIPFYGNTSTTSVTRWGINDANPLGPGTVLVTLADAAGGASPETVTAVSDGLNSPAVKPVGSGDLSVQAATEFPVTLDMIIATDGTNPDLVANITSAITLLSSRFFLGPSRLEKDLIISILAGHAIGTVGVLVNQTTVVYMTLDLPAFPGVIEVTDTGISPPDAFSINVPAGNALVLTVGTVTLVNVG